MKITLDLINAGASNRGGWNRKQVEMLGLKWPLTWGWKTRLIGTEISPENAQKFLELKDTTKRPRKIKGPHPVRSELPFVDGTSEQDKRIVDSFYRWMIAREPEIGHKLIEPLQYAVRKQMQKFGSFTPPAPMKIDKSAPLVAFSDTIDKPPGLKKFVRHVSKKPAPSVKLSIRELADAMYPKE